MCPLNELNDQAHLTLASRQVHIATDAVEIARLLETSHVTAGATVSSVSWKNYVAYVTHIVAEGLVAAIATSLTYLHHQVWLHYFPETSE